MNLHYRLEHVPLYPDRDEQFRLRKFFTGLRVLDRQLQSRIDKHKHEETQNAEQLFFELLPFVRELVNNKAYNYLAEIPWAYVESQIFVSIREWRKLAWLKSRHCSIDRSVELPELWLMIEDEIQIINNVVFLPGLSKVGYGMPTTHKEDSRPKIVHLFQQNGRYELDILFEDPEKLEGLAVPAEVATWTERVQDLIRRENILTPDQSNRAARREHDGVLFREYRTYEYRAKIFNHLRHRQRQNQEVVSEAL